MAKFKVSVFVEGVVTVEVEANNKSHARLLAVKEKISPRDLCEVIPSGTGNVELVPPSPTQGEQGS